VQEYDIIFSRSILTLLIISIPDSI